MKQLILIRHGKPEPPGTAATDALRALTPEGRAALAAPTGFPATFTQIAEAADACGLGALDSAGPIALWTSPADRARATAEEARRALEGLGVAAGAPQDCDALWEQDDVAFLDEVAAADAQTVVACGHIPFMNRLTAWLTGEDVSFNPGAAALVLVPDVVMPGACALISFVPGPAA